MCKFFKRHVCYSRSSKLVSLQHENTLRLERMLVITKLTPSFRDSLPFKIPLHLNFSGIIRQRDNVNYKYV
jgi:hypothetical protein